MANARGNGQNGGHYYSNITQPVKIDLQFVVDSADSAGKGIRSLKSNGYVQNVFMNTSATPASGNPNPIAGYALIQLKNNYNVSLQGFHGFVSPNTGSALTSTTVSHVYVITSVGTTTKAQWVAAGVPTQFTPAVGLSFVAKATGSIGGTGTVKAPGVSGITAVEVVGDVSKSINSSSIASYAGANLIVQFLAATNSSTTTLIPAAPADGQLVNLSLFFDASSVTIDGL